MEGLSPMKVVIPLILLVCWGNQAYTQSTLGQTSSKSVPTVEGQDYPYYGRPFTIDLCSLHSTWGYIPGLYPHTGSQGDGITNRQAIAERFEAPASGTIDSVYFVVQSMAPFESWGFNLGKIPAILRVFKSNILPGQDYGTYVSPMQVLPWGYYFNLYDDGGISPFFDQTTDTQWISTNADPTWNLFGDELWGLGGVNLEIDNARDSVVGVDLEGLLGYNIEVTRGESFFICIRNTLHFGPLEYDLAFFGTFPGNTRKPPTHWRFRPTVYTPFPQYGKGWSGIVAQGDCFYYYTMTTNYPVPVEIPPSAWVSTELYDDAAIPVQLLKYCQQQYLDSANIGSVWLDYQTNGGDWSSVQVQTVGDTMFTTEVPRQPSMASLNLRRRILDSTGNLSDSASAAFRVYGLKQNGYMADTSSGITWNEIDSIGEPIPYDNFLILNGDNSVSQGNYDDATAGPVDLGFEFSLFGATPIRYAWIGINGGIGLTDSIAPPVYISKNGYFAPWSIPGATTSGIPMNFVAPLYSDLRLVTPAGDSGKIYIRRDSVNRRCIVEWADMSASLNDTDFSIRFEVIFDQRDTSMTFVYNSLGVSGLEHQAVVGFRADSVNWVSVSNFGTPSRFVPRTTVSIKFRRDRTTSVSPVTDGIPVDYRLYPNWPNPFNPITRISYDLPVESRVRLTVYDVLGREMAVLINGYQRAGNQSVLWNAERHSSGVYFYKLEASPIMLHMKPWLACGKMVLIK